MLDTVSVSFVHCCPFVGCAKAAIPAELKFFCFFAVLAHVLFSLSQRWLVALWLGSEQIGTFAHSSHMKVPCRFLISTKSGCSVPKLQGSLTECVAKNGATENPGYCKGSFYFGIIQAQWVCLQFFEEPLQWEVPVGFPLKPQ